MAIKSSNNWPVVCRRLAAGTLAIYSAIGCQKVYAAPQEAPFAAVATDPKTFAIPRGPLRDVIATFETESGISISLAAPGIADLASPGVSGNLPIARALAKALEGTGVRFTFTSARSAVLELQAVASSLEVQEKVAPLAASSPKFGDNLDDIPQTITAVPAQLMEEQNATTLRDTLRNVAGISLAAGEGGAQGDNLTIRGFTARNDLFIDGMRDFGSYYRDPFNLQEVEVLQGPDSVTFGRGSTGGVVNQASKTPTLSHSLTVGIDGGSDATRRVTADFNTPLAHGFSFRLNVMGDEGNIAGRNVAENRRDGVAPSLAWGLGTPTRVTLSYMHQNADDIPDYGIPWLFNQPAPVNRNNYYGFNGDRNFLRTYDDIATLKAEHDFAGHFTLRNQTRYANYLRDAQITEAQIVAGATTATPLSAIGITRNEITVNSVESLADEQLDLVGNFSHNTIVAGGELSREISDPIRHAFTNVPTTSLLNPDPTQPFTGYSVAVSSLVHTTANSAGTYVMDTLKLGKKIEVVGGFRWDRMNAHYTNAAGTSAGAFNHLDNMPSWRAAVSYHPFQAAILYAAAGTSFNPSAESLSLSTSTTALPPEKNRSYEGGAKLKVPHTTWSLRAALFTTTKLNAREPDPNNSLLNVLAGTRRVNGFTFEADGHITRRGELRLGYAYLDPKVIASNAYPLAVGAMLANVPRDSFNAWNTWRLPKRWEFGAGTNFASKRTASSTVPLDPTTGLIKQVPGYWVFNAMVEHPISEHISFQLNGYNLANRYYYDQLHPAHVILGPGRSVLASVKFKF